jgi:SulP family sulfate permease
MAFAMASGVEPERGLFTAIVAGFCNLFFRRKPSTNRWSNGAFVVIVYSIVERHGYDGLALATLLAGGLLILMGAFRLGTLIKFVPHPLIIGFTSGLALVVFSSQIKDLLGLQMDEAPIQFIDKWAAYYHMLPTLDWVTTALGVGMVAFIFALKKWAPSIPWGIASIIVATAVTAIFHLPIDTVTSRFGQLPSSLPMPTFNFDFARTLDVLPDAITIAILAGIESLLSAVIADSVTGGRINRIANSLAKVLQTLVRSYLEAFLRQQQLQEQPRISKQELKHPIAGMIHATVVMVLLWSCASLVGGIPLAALSAILVVVAWQMSELSHFVKIISTSRGDAAILLTAFSLTVLIDITIAVEVGMLMAAFLFMKRMSDVKHVITLETKLPEQSVEVYKMRGPFFFGVTDRLKNLIMQMDVPPKLIVLRMKHVPLLDASAMQALREMSNRCITKGSRLVLVEVQPEPTELLQEYGLGDLINSSLPELEAYNFKKL